MQKLNFSYDKENDDLFLYNPNSKSKGSIELGDIILDFNNKKELAGIQMMNASKLIKEMMSENTNGIKSVLNDLQECKVDVKVKGNLLIIKIYLLSRMKELTPIISIPNIKEKSPALAYA
ncbi:MAG: DUF2283 domain-containing protein [Nanoarchaeota archaeon]|nr:DUF2283 domain-containing protein [Nanoarchaeota archaeon]MBU1321296.1 DUF2283 domain-containing protein [Nanoarchaeota archaeon]MBU1597465.1 DUF2283 domain-containing protein [Nanoarchaeota archaeon]MBU2441468.1 DUF2283 domain-containing protein [Nanoarchaeota archaeon]